MSGPSRTAPRRSFENPRVYRLYLRGKARSVRLLPVVDVTAGFVPLFPRACPPFPWLRFPWLRCVFVVILFIEGSLELQNLQQETRSLEGRRLQLGAQFRLVSPLPHRRSGRLSTGCLGSQLCSHPSL